MLVLVELQVTVVITLLLLTLGM